MRSAGNFSPEWGYLAPAPSFARTARVVLVATAIGATAGVGVVLSLVDRPSEPEKYPGCRARDRDQYPRRRRAIRRRRRAGSNDCAREALTAVRFRGSGAAERQARYLRACIFAHDAANPTRDTTRGEGGSAGAFACGFGVRKHFIAKHCAARAGSQRDHARPSRHNGRYRRGRDRGRSGNRPSFGNCGAAESRRSCTGRCTR
jgi:hypothetical protein